MVTPKPNNRSGLRLRWAIAIVLGMLLLVGGAFEALIRRGSRSVDRQVAAGFQELSVATSSTQREPILERLRQLGPAADDAIFLHLSQSSSGPWSSKVYERFYKTRVRTALPDLIQDRLPRPIVVKNGLAAMGPSLWELGPGFCRRNVKRIETRLERASPPDARIWARALMWSVYDQEMPVGLKTWLETDPWALEVLGSSELIHPARPLPDQTVKATLQSFRLAPQPMQPILGSGLGRLSSKGIDVTKVLLRALEGRPQEDGDFHFPQGASAGGMPLQTRKSVVRALAVRLWTTSGVDKPDNPTQSAIANVLRKCLQDPDPEIRESAFHMLVHSGKLSEADCKLALSDTKAFPFTLIHIEMWLNGLRQASPSVRRLIGERIQLSLPLPWTALSPDRRTHFREMRVALTPDQRRAVRLYCLLQPSRLEDYISYFTETADYGECIELLVALDVEEDFILRGLRTVMAGSQTRPDVRHLAAWVMTTLAPEVEFSPTAWSQHSQAEQGRQFKILELLYQHRGKKNLFVDGLSERLRTTDPDQAEAALGALHRHPELLPMVVEPVIACLDANSHHARLMAFQLLAWHAPGHLPPP